MVYFMLLLIGLSVQNDKTGYDHLSQVNYERNIANGLRYRLGVDIDQHQLYIYDMSDGVLYLKKNGVLSPIDTLNRRYLDDTMTYFDSNSRKLLFLDAGLGRVFNYDVDTKELSRIDRSYRLRSFYGAAGYLDGLNRLLFFGGTGEFFAKNRLLVFNKNQNREWDEHIVDNRPKSNEQNRALYWNLLDNRFYLFRTFQNTLNVYTANRVHGGEPIESWVLYKEYSTQNFKVSGAHNSNVISNKQAIGNKLNIMGNYFYDLETHTLTMWNSNEQIYGVMQGSNPDTLAVISAPSSTSFKDLINFDIEKHSVDDFFTNQTFLVIKPDKNIKPIYVLSILFLLLFSVGAYLYWTRKQPDSADATENIITTDPLFVINGNHAFITKQGKRIYFYDPLEIKLITIINEMSEEQLDTIDLDELDEKLFNGIGHKTQITTKRNQLIKGINKALAADFIIKKKAKSDRRRKLIKVQFQLLNNA